MILVLAAHLLFTNPILPVSPPPIPIVEEILDTQNIYCSCVKTARLYAPNLARGNAEDFKPNTALPRPNDILLLDYDGVSHLAVIEEMDNLGYNIVEGNFNKCKQTRRHIKYGASEIRGFHSPDTDTKLLAKSN